jgi:hypothetical protein
MHGRCVHMRKRTRTKFLGFRTQEKRKSGGFEEGRLKARGKHGRARTVRVEFEAEAFVSTSSVSLLVSLSLWGWELGPLISRGVVPGHRHVGRIIGSLSLHFLHLCRAPKSRWLGFDEDKVVLARHSGTSLIRRQTTPSSLDSHQTICTCFFSFYTCSWPETHKFKRPSLSTD